MGFAFESGWKRVVVVEVAITEMWDGGHDGERQGCIIHQNESRDSAIFVQSFPFLVHDKTKTGHQENEPNLQKFETGCEYGLCVCEIANVPPAQNYVS